MEKASEVGGRTAGAALHHLLWIIKC